MGWRGNLRSVVAYTRKLEREELRRASLATKQYKAMLKQEEFENGKFLAKCITRRLVLVLFLKLRQPNWVYN
jgi:hypothetical protein